MLLVWHAEGNKMRCPKCHRLLSDIFPAELLPQKWMARLRTGEQHSVTMKDDFEKGYNSMDKLFGSANFKTSYKVAPPSSVYL